MAGCGDCREGIRLWSYRAWIGAMVLLFSGWVGAAQAGTPVAWDGGTGIWSDPNAWNLGLIPNNNGQTYDVTIGLSTDDVSLDLSVAVDTVANAGTLRLLEGFSLTLAQPGGLTNTGFFSVSHSGTSGLFGAFSNSGFAWVESGTLELNNNVNNSGTIWMGDAAFGGSDARLHFLDDAAFTGSGELYFLPATLSVTEQPSVELSLGTTLTNDVDHRIHGGSGSIQGPGELVNLGQIDADIPLRTLTVDVDEFTNEGQLWARSGNLDVNVDNWINSGEVLVANGGSSVFTGSLLTNDNTGVIKSVGGAELTLMQSVTNFNSIATGGGGQITFGGASTVVSNFPGAVIDAGAGTIRFEASNGSIQNLGMVRADDGSIEIANGTDMFGGDLVLSNASSVTVTAGTTTLTQVRTSLDATSTMAVTDRGTGIATLTFDGIMHNAGGTLKSRSDSGGTTTFNLMGDIYDDSGTFVAEGGAINISNAMLTESGVLSLDMRNGGDISFTNVDSTASQINVDWVGTGGDLVFNDYWKNGTPTALDISGWSADGGAFTVSGGSVLTGSGLNTLPAGTTLTVTGANSSLSLSDLSLSPAGSLIDLVSGGTLGAPNLAIDGEVKLRTGTFDGNLTLNPSATFTATGAGNLVTGDFSWVGDRDVEITTATLGFGGTATVASGSSLRITGNSGRFNGNGVIDNSGVIEGGAPSTGNSTFVDVDIINNAGGVIRAYQNGVPTNTYLQLSGDITNVGLMEADGANLYFTGANVVNSGTIQALDNADGSKLMFLNSATVTDQGGTTLVDGLSSRLEVTGGANVDLGALTLSNGATGYISGANTVLSTSSNFNITEGTVFTVASSSRVDGTGVDLAGELLFQSSSVIDAPVTVNPTGQITANSGIGTLNGLTTVLNDGMGGDGRISLVANGARINGAGVISNNGVIEGGAPSSGNGTYLDVDVVNNSDGVIRAFQNGTPTNTYLYLSGDITNNGTMEADGANLYFTTGVNVQNSGLLRTVDNAVASKLMFLNGARVTDAGGSTQIDGALSTLEISAAADVDLGQLSFTNGGTGFVTGVGSVLSADMTINPGTAFTVTGSGRLSGTHAQVDGQLLVESSSVVDAPVSVDGVLVLRSSSRMDDSVTVNPTGQLLADSSTVTLNGPVTVLNDGMGGDGRISLSANSARINGAGVITNSGLVEGGATSNSQPTYLDAALVNNVDGVVRAYRNGTTTNTRFEMPDDITNAGVMEADGAHLYFSTGTNMLNSGTLRTVDNVDANSKLIFLSSAKVTNAGGSTQIDGSQGRLEVSGAADVELGQLTFTNGGTGSVTDASTVVTADTTINPGAAFTITSSGRLSGPHAQVDGQLLVQSSAVVDAPVTVDGELVVRSSGRIDAPVTVNPTGQLLADSSIATLNEAVTVTNDGMGGNGRISLVANSARINGAGLITNSGLIEGGATSSSQPTYLDNDLVNNADGIVRAFRNGTTSNTRFEMPDDITNAGVMEADGANLYFTTGTNMLNSGTLRTVNNVDANSKLIFLGSARVIDSGGTTQIDGSQSSLEVSGLADVELGTLSFTNGGTGYVTGASTVVRADTTINEGSTFSVQSSGRITGAGVALGGELIVQSSAVVDAPLTVNPTGQVTANSSIATFNKPVSVLNDGMGGAGTISIVANSARINGTGVITNSGVIEGGATSNNNSTYLDSEVVNNADGVLRAFSNGGATGTYFRLSDEVRNAGVMEGDGGNLYMTTATVANSGTMRALNGGKLTFIDGTKVANGGGSIHVMDTGTALVSGANTIVDSSAMQVDGSMEVYNATVRAPVTIGATGEVSSTYQSSGYPARFNGPMTIENGGTLSMYKYYTTVTGDGLITNHGLIRGASDHSSYPQTYLYNDVVNESDGVVRAEQNAAITNSRLQIYGDITNAGLMEANGGNLWFMSGSSVVNSGTLQAVDGNEIRIQGGVTVTDAGGSVLSLSNGGTAYITDANTVVTAQTSIADGSMLNLRNGALLSGTGVQVDGDMEVYNATVDAPVTISATGEVTSTYGSPSYPARFDAPMTIDNGGTLSMLVSSAAVSGNGLITNHGLIQGASNSNNTPTYLYNDVVNASDGVIRARQNDNGATNTYLQMYGDITNDGVMEADGARLYFSGATVQNSGTIRAVDHADGSRLIFASASRVTDAGGVGIVDVDGPLNTLEISGASNVQLGTFSLTNGATGFVSDANSVLTADMTIGDGSVFTARNSARITGPGVQVDGELVIQSSAVVDSGVTVAPTGQLTADYGTYSSSNRVTLNGPVTIQNDGMGGIGTVTMGGSYHSGFNGTGSITNNGLIEGGSTISGYSTFIDNDLVNNVDGVVRAFRNGETTNTYFQLRGDIVNAGLLEADGANLYFPGSVMQNSGTLRTVDNPAANSKLIFLGGATVTDAGGSTQLDGALSSLEVSGLADVELGSLSFSNGATGYVTGSGTVVTADTTIDAGATFSVMSSGRLRGPGLQLDGDLVAQSSGVVDAPITMSPTGQITANSGTVTFNAPISIANDGMGGNGTISLISNSARINGGGVITNSGLIEGGAPSNGNATYLDSQLVNNADGVVRAFSNGGATNTTFQLSGVINNAGLMEADAANLSFSGALVDNTNGSWSALNGGRLLVSSSFVSSASGSAATINGADSSLELTGASMVTLDSLALTNGGDLLVSDTNTSLFVQSPFTVGENSLVKVQNGAALGGAGVRIDSDMEVYNARVIAPVTIGATGEVTSTYHSSGGPARFDGPMTIENGGKLSMYNYYSAVSGKGLITNHGLIQGASEHSSYILTYLYNDVANAADGVIRARQNDNGAVNTRMEVHGNITNDGLMEANGASLYFTGATVQNSGPVRAVDHPDGSHLMFLGSTLLNDVGGSGVAEVDGALSTIEVSGGANVSFGTLSLTNNATGFVSGSSSSLSADTTINVGSMFKVQNSARLGGAGVQIDGDMEVYNATVNAPATIAATGEVISTYRGAGGPARFDAPVTIENGGKLSMYNYYSAISGDGLITNHGLIQGASEHSSYILTYLYNDVANAADGVIRARQNDNGAVNTQMQVYGNITNEGLMEADGARLHFTGATVNNSGTIRATNHGAGSRLQFVNGSQLVDVGGGGIGEVNGSAAMIEVSGGSDVEFGSLLLANNATGTVSGLGSTLSGGLTINAGSTLSLTSSAQLMVTAGGMVNSGVVNLSSGTTFTADAPVVSNVGSMLSFANGSNLDFNSSLTMDGALELNNNDMDVDGDLSFGADGRLRAVSGASIILNGDFSNASTQRGDFDSSVTVLELNASLNADIPLALEVACEDMGDMLSGLVNNFALDTLLLSGIGEYVELVDLFDNPLDGGVSDALYVSTLTIMDLDSRLILNGLSVYYGTFTGDISQIDMTFPGSSFIQLTRVEIPEPATMWLLIVGAGWVLGGGRRRRFR